MTPPSSSHHRQTAEHGVFKYCQPDRLLISFSERESSGSTLMPGNYRGIDGLEALGDRRCGKWTHAYLR
jgi:hypothetical protein